jgi:multidrug efflux pump subunit AcrB
MNQLVRIALARPYTFVVLALLLLIVGPLTAFTTPTDIFPDIKIPVISVVWQYTGLPPGQMAGRIVYPYERVLTTTVNDIQHIESQSLPGFGIVKIFFQPTVDIRTATAQVTSISQTVTKQMPAGITPPLILNYNASTVPIIQLALSSKQMTEQQVSDQGQNFLRPRLTTVAGAAIPYPFGGKPRQVQIDLDLNALQARGLAPQDVQLALAAQNLIIPVGTQKIGKFEYTIQLNGSPDAIEALNDLPVKSAADGSIIHIRDVANVRDGNAPQTNIVHVNDTRSVLITILKNGSASTLAVIDGIKNVVNDLRGSLPQDLQIQPVGDQSLFVKAAISGVAREGIIAALLTSVMILLFLGSWRSTVIIAISIPLSVMGAIAGLAAIGETMNIMTLGGLALAVGILVDDATVTIENINTHLEQGKDVEPAIVDGAAQIVTPAFVSLLSICIVFVPMFFLQGVARFLFVPMAEAVMLAMAWSFILSRTLVPTMAKYLLKKHEGEHASEAGEASAANSSRVVGSLVRFQQGFMHRFERTRNSYHGLLEMAIEHRRPFVIVFLAFVVLSFALLPMLGRNFFPSVDSGALLIHARAQIGTRLEESARRFAQIEDAIREVIPPEELASVVDNIGLPQSGINMSYNNTGTIGPQDGDIQIKLTEKHRPTDEYIRILRERLPQQFGDVTFSFLPADIISQILNFGAPAPIDLQVRGPNQKADYAYARQLMQKIKYINGIADVRIQQSGSYPQFRIDVDRVRAQNLGITERDVTNNLVVSLAGSSQVAPSFWLNPTSGVSYNIVAQAPQYRIDSLEDLENLPLTAPGAAAPQVLGAVANITRETSAAVESHYDIQPVVEIYASTQNRDLGAVAAEIQSIVKDAKKDLPKGTTVVLRGQVQTMNDAFYGLTFGLLGAIVLIYLLIVVNFQSWIDPFVIITALPAALAGIIWMLFATGTTLSVPALTGAIMCMGVATANSILVISFARERLDAGSDSITAALEAGFARFRPVLMTALAMIIGMVPMALSMGEGGEQNAPLGRAVIGGLIFATAATLFFVPVVFSIAHARKRQPVPDTGAIVHAS